MSARELVNYGLEDQLFPDKGLSRTPQKSMQARLSIDILNNEKSKFVRVRRGRFLLKEQLSIGKHKDAEVKPNYVAVRRQPTIPTENVLCIPKSQYAKELDFQGIGHIGLNDPLAFLNNETTEYVPRIIAETVNDRKQIITYTVIQYQSKILSFRRGQYNRAASFLRGAQCIGFGGHVSDEDNTLFSYQDLGIRENAAREISEELMLPSGRPKVDPAELEYLGILNDDSSDVGVRHAAVVLRYWVDDWNEWKKVSKGETSINRINWIDTVGEPINLAEFEYWSQLVIRRFFESSLSTVPSYKILRRAIFKKPHILCVVGSIGSGKTATSDYFQQQNGYSEVNSGKIIAQLLDLPPIPITDRAIFQHSALEFISESAGPKLLGDALAKAARDLKSDKIIVDGIRHPETLEQLKNASDLPVALLYVYTPPDIAFQMYREREGYDEGEISFAEFTKKYNAPVESKIRYMLSDADILTFNWIGFEAYHQSLVELSSDLYG